MPDPIRDEQPVERAIRRRHILILQREAMGLFAHADVDRLYPLPPVEKPSSGR